MTDNTKNKRGVFSMITGKDGVEDMISKFINEKNINPDPRIDKYLKNYQKIVDKIMKPLEDLSKDEEIILQLRARDNVNPKYISFYLAKDYKGNMDYIYARTIFYRHDKKIKDIRVIAGKLSDFKVPFEKVIKNKKFLQSTVEKLKETMNVEIEKTLKNYK